MQQILVPLPPGQNTVLTAVDFNTRFVGFYNLGTGRATLGFNKPAVEGEGYPMMPALNAGDLGGGYEFDRLKFPRFNGVIHCTSAAGTTILVMLDRD